ncbi:MAG: uracil phosphoribosyltransferase [Chloroflexota bacterium]
MVIESQHPLIKDKLTALRDVASAPPKFRALVNDLSTLLCYEATHDLVDQDYSVETPMGTAVGKKIAQKIGLIPILRAGLGMVDSMLTLIPEAQVWHIGMYRNEETLEPVWYYNKLPDQPTVDICFVMDPMLATGGSAVATVDLIKKWGVQTVKFVGLLAAPEGIKALQDAHPDVDIHIAHIDSHLNDIGYIVPGLGDAGDRQFSTT